MKIEKYSLNLFVNLEGACGVYRDIGTICLPDYDVSGMAPGNACGSVAHFPLSRLSMFSRLVYDYWTQ